MISIVKLKMYTSRNISRLWRKYKTVRFNHNNPADNSNGNLNCEELKNHRDFKTLLQKYREKIVFNSYLEHDKLQFGHFKYYLKTIKEAKKLQMKSYRERCLSPLPLALQYYVDKEKIVLEDEREQPAESTQVFQLPFSNMTSVAKVNEIESEIPEKQKSETQMLDEEEFDKSNINNWMTNYEHFDDTKLITEEEPDEEILDSEWCKQYGTPDPSINISRVPCGGCGALLHCNDPSIPGYLPSELFVGREIEELKTMECQRCHFLKEYNIALDVTVHPEEFERLLQSISRIKSLVLLMVDLLDFPCSLWPGIVDIIGTNRPLIVVANKVDLLPGDSIGYVKRIREAVMAEINKTKLKDANIKYVAIISAKTGFGVEDLISAMFKLWLYKGDVFLVGSTNVGKSSLFNTLLQSDYCKVQAADLVHRATVSRWPGTTLHLLKFPVNRPTGWKIRERTNRLKSDYKLRKLEKVIRKAQVDGKIAVEAPSLISYIGRTFTDYKNSNENVGEKHTKLTVLDEKHEIFRKSKWCYDTPGVVLPDQVLSLLSTEELLMTLPKNLIRPQTYYLHKGTTIFIGGLARLDFVDCEEPCRFTIFCSESLPITVTKTEDADHVYEQFIGTELFAVPLGSEERLKNWPGLQKKEELVEFRGEGPNFCCGDVVLSSIAWVSVAAKPGKTCKLAAWTPEARGIHRRYPSLLPYSINLKGKRIANTPAYMIGTVYDET